MYIHHFFSFNHIVEITANFSDVETALKQRRNSIEVDVDLCQEIDVETTLLYGYRRRD